jgi:1,4-alpha-glucan branching enzyme
LIIALGKLYRGTPCLWRGDPDSGSFSWIDCEDREQSVFSYQRWSEGEHVLVILNMTPLPRWGYRIGAPVAGGYRVLLSSDAPQFGGSGTGHGIDAQIHTEGLGCNGMAQSLVLDVPPLGALVLGPVPAAGATHR